MVSSVKKKHTKKQTNKLKYTHTNLQTKQTNQSKKWGIQNFRQIGNESKNLFGSRRSAFHR